jgi:hypothetical protein
MNGILKIEICGQTVELEQVERGYFTGSIELGTTKNQISMHVEAIESSIVDGRTTATNDIYQIPIDNWIIRNDGCAPHLLKIGKKQYFINVEVFAR